MAFLKDFRINNKLYLLKSNVFKALESVMCDVIKIRLKEGLQREVEMKPAAKY